MGNQLYSKRKILFLGDSYTIGEGVLPEESWPLQLVMGLKAKLIVIDQFDIIAKTGWTTAELNEAINQFSPGNDYDLVTLLIGVNNQYRGQQINIFKLEFENLLNRAIGFAKNIPSNVIVISIPGYELTSFSQEETNLIRRREAYPDIQDLTTEAIGKSIDRYNEIAMDTVNALNSKKAKQITFINITPLTRQKAYLTTKDGLHYSREMYEEWARIILPYAVNILTT